MSIEVTYKDGADTKAAKAAATYCVMHCAESKIDHCLKYGLCEACKVVLDNEFRRNIVTVGGQEIDPANLEKIMRPVPAFPGSNNIARTRPRDQKKPLRRR